MRILVIEDDLKSCTFLQEYLDLEGYIVEVAHDGNTGLKRSLSGDYDFIILDVRLPGLDGFDVLLQIRERSDVPILMLTGCVADADRIKGLDMGADDYLNKPFNPPELLARIRTILRRSGKTAVGQKIFDTLTIGDIFLDLRARRVCCKGEEVLLTAAEFTLLEILLSAAGQVVPREEMVRRVQGRRHNPFDRSIDVHISRLRKKLSKHGDGSERIKSVRGVGHFYALSAANSLSAVVMKPDIEG